ncbi:uncharacterized protein LOC106752812 [Vigna radiata var. radiata]|uniref:Uncharacterized protein LOC106752812 n=1 Tax=Vigna radiata var. radiata TaxID=3916 RepID=A0A1S3T8H8_VIGRR|nr:uncharacterized protein LOC106752812 [Vigna radiata var. radiata]
MTGLIHSNLPIFDGKDFDDWCVKMEAILRFQEVDEVVKKGLQEPLKDDSEAVSKAAFAKEVWDILQERYGNTGKVKKIRLQSLQRQYELLGIGENETVMEYMGRIQALVNDMRACGKVVKDRKIIRKILRMLTPQYDHIVITIEECKDLEMLKFEELQNSLVVHEQQLLERKNAEKAASQATNQALQARSKQSFKNRGRGTRRLHGKGGHNGGRNSNLSDQNNAENVDELKEGSNRGGGNSRGRGRKGSDKRNIQCYTCNKYGHNSAECWYNESTKKNKNDDAANLA